MAKLIELIEFEKQTSKKLKNEYDNRLKTNEELIKNYKNLTELLDDKDIYLRNMITRNILKNIKFREEYWREHKRLPNSLINVNTCEGYVKDNYSALALLPQVKLSKLRELANALKMVIIPIHYTEISKLFSTQDNESELTNKFNIFRNLLINDKTREYQMYILCPINYYSVWEQIKSDIDKSCYFADYFENVSTTLQLMIPAQKNLYLSIQSNNDNLKTIETSFNENVKSLNKQINTISNKINKLENDFLNETKRLNDKINNQEDELKKLEIKMVTEINNIYKNLDPILFAVEDNIDIVEDETNAIIGLCWGKDIDDNYVKLKGLSINNKNIEKANPISTILNIKDIQDIENVKKIKYNEIHDIIFDKLYNTVTRIYNNNVENTTDTITIADKNLDIVFSTTTNCDWCVEYEVKIKEKYIISEGILTFYNNEGVKRKRIYPIAREFCNEVIKYLY